MIALQQPKGDLPVLRESLERCAGIRRTAQGSLGVFHPKPPRFSPVSEAALNLFGAKHASSVNQMLGCRFGFWRLRRVVGHRPVEATSRSHIFRLAIALGRIRPQLSPRGRSG